MGETLTVFLVFDRLLWIPFSLSLRSIFFLSHRFSHSLIQFLSLFPIHSYTSVHPECDEVGVLVHALKISGP